MTVEKQDGPEQFIVLGVHGAPVSFIGSPIEDERDNPLVFYSFEEALKVAVWYAEDMDCPTTIVLLSELASDIIKEALDTPKFDYVPQKIEAIKNADIDLKNIEHGVSIAISDFLPTSQQPQVLVDDIMKIINANRGIEVLNTPQCHICRTQYPIDKFDSSAWLQITTDLPYNEHGDNMIWICPECKTRANQPKG